MALSLLGSATCSILHRGLNGTSNMRIAIALWEKGASWRSQVAAWSDMGVIPEEGGDKAWRDHYRCSSLGKAHVPGNRLQGNRWVGWVEKNRAGLGG
jgi:hypothetical protein